MATLKKEPFLPVVDATRIADAALAEWDKVTEEKYRGRMSEYITQAIQQCGYGKFCFEEREKIRKQVGAIIARGRATRAA